MASAPMLLEFMDNDDDVAASSITAYCCIESNTIMSTAAVAAAAMRCLHQAQCVVPRSVYVCCVSLVARKHDIQVFCTVQKFIFAVVDIE